MNEPSPLPSSGFSIGSMTLALVMAAFVGAAGTLWTGWVGDDIAVVRDNGAVDSLGGVAQALGGVKHPGPSEPGAYRPVTLASFALTSAVAGHGPAGREPLVDHIVNVLLHILGTWLLFRTILRLAPTVPLLAFAGALVFAVHPLHIRALAPLSGRADLLALLFSCATALAWFGFRRGTGGLLPVAVFTWFLALGSHEVALGVPVLLAFAPPRGAPRQTLALAAFVPALVLYLIGGGAPTGEAAVSAGSQVLGGLDVFGRTILQWIVPVRLPTEPIDAWVAPSSNVTAFVVLGITLFFLVRATLGRVGWLAQGWCAAFVLFFLPLLLHAGSQPVGLSLAYVVTAPLALATGSGALALARRGSVLSVGLACLVVVGALAFLSVNESEHWRDDESRFNRRMALDPDDYLGQQAYARFLRGEARAEQLRAVRLRADDPERGRALRHRAALLERASEWSLRALQGKGRQQAGAWRERGLVLAARSKWADALPHLLHAAKLDPRLADTSRMEAEVARGGMQEAAELFFAIGRAHEALGRRDEAAEQFRFASLLAPDNVKYLRQAGQTLSRVQRYREGIPLLERALRETTDPDKRKLIATIIESEQRAATNLSSRYMGEGRDAQQQGKYRQAVKSYERALEVNDALIDAHLQVGYLRGWYFGNYAQGYDHLNRAERILRKQDPAHPRLAEVEKFRKALAKAESEEPDQDETDQIEELRKKQEEELRKK